MSFDSHPTLVGAILPARPLRQLIAKEDKYKFLKPSRQKTQKVVPGAVVKLISSFDSDDPDAPSARHLTKPWR